RQMSISRFGIYNYDVYSEWEEPIFANADFSVQDGPKEVLLEQVFLVSRQGRMVVSYPQAQWHRFNYDAKRANMLVALGDDMQVYTLTAADFSKQAKKQGNQKAVAFQLEAAGFAATDKAQLDMVLNGDMAAL
ncbi:MAG: hypothetical protein AAFQ37_11490, partial [Bacteroidota bacterium]